MEVSELSTLMQQYHGKLDGRMAAFEQTVAEFKQHQRRVDEIEGILRRPNGSFAEFGGNANGKGLAAQLFDNAEFKDFIGKGARGHLRLLLSGLPELEHKTLIDSTAVGSSIPGILVPERAPGIVSGPVPRVRVRDLIPVATTQNNAIEFIREVLFTNAASPQEAEGSAKAESGVTFEIAHSDVQTVAHWIPVSKQVMADMTALNAYLRVKMVEKLKDVEDSELLNGTGIGTHLTGLCTGATTVVGTHALAGDTYIDQICAALTELEDAGYDPDGLIVHPADWRAMCRVKTEDGGANTGAYILGGPASNVPPQLWNLPVARTRAMVQGQFLVGQLRRSCMIWDRQQVVVDISDSHEDYFTRNLLALRVEERLTLTIFDSEGFRVGQFS